ncbi:MAG: tryptophan synthase subunit alpha [Lachnospiraceae bacterium]|nr:tryptophan synthase subunit alpha [Lachnospiraceae bacterium]
MEIILYLSNGYPTIDASIQMAKEYADAGCRMIEIDFPSRNPFLESEMIQNRMQKALEVCDDYDAYMEEIVEVKKSLPDVRLLVLSYENTIREIGVEKFIRFCLENEFHDVLLVGLTNNEVKEKIIAAGLRVSCYVQYQMLEEEIESAKNSNGFVYLQAKPKPGQGYVNPNYPTLKDCVQGLRDHGIDRPIYCGVGVYTPEDVRMVKEAGGDAAFIGSTILKLQEDIPAMKEMIGKFVAECR